MRCLAVSSLLIPSLAFTAAMALPAAPVAAQAWRDVTCESWNYREASCPTPGAVRVQLVRVLGGQCVEGQSWIHDGNVIRVRNGCRATFRIDTNAGWGGSGGWGDGGNFGNDRWQVMRCESWNYRDQRCPTNGAIRGARMLRVIAGDCREGATWRWDRRAITVRNGCRAEFEIMPARTGWGGNGGSWQGGGGGNWQGGGGGQPVARVNCESWNYRQAQCPIARGSQVRLTRVLGGNCVQGRSWGWEASFIWVKDGCRASFDVY